MLLSSVPRSFSTAAGWQILLLVLLPVAGCASPTKSAPQEQATAEPVRLETATGTVHGTLLVPGGPGPHPVALMVAGSGPTDRNGNSALLPGANNSLKLLAEGLAEQGVASLRYDKRGVAQSASAGPAESDLRFETYVEDASAWLKQLKADSRFSAVAVVGHSEGSLIGMLAARQARADALVSVAGIARRASEVLREQLRPQLPAELWQESERILAELEAGRTTDSVPAALFALFRPSVQPYLISWFRFVPTDQIVRLSIPVLIAQGTTDIQVSVAEAEALKEAKPDAELLIVEGMNHVLKLVSADLAQQQASYSDPSLPVSPVLVEHTAQILRSAQRLP
jgi:pimeloyl-ACP methyl ester carboxylesterase